MVMAFYSTTIPRLDKSTRGKSWTGCLKERAVVYRNEEMCTKGSGSKVLLKARVLLGFCVKNVKAIIMKVK